MGYLEFFKRLTFGVRIQLNVLSCCDYNESQSYKKRRQNSTVFHISCFFILQRIIKISILNYDTLFPAQKYNGTVNLMYTYEFICGACTMILRDLGHRASRVK